MYHDDAAATLGASLSGLVSGLSISTPFVIEASAAPVSGSFGRCLLSMLPGSQHPFHCYQWAAGTNLACCNHTPRVACDICSTAQSVLGLWFVRQSGAAHIGVAGAHSLPSCLHLTISLHCRCCLLQLFLQQPTDPNVPKPFLSSAHDLQTMSLLYCSRDLQPLGGTNASLCPVHSG